VFIQNQSRNLLGELKKLYKQSVMIKDEKGGNNIKTPTHSTLRIFSSVPRRFAKKFVERGGRAFIINWEGRKKDQRAPRRGRGTDIQV